MIRLSYDFGGSLIDFELHVYRQRIPFWSFGGSFYERGDNEKQNTCTCGKEFVQNITHNYYISGLPGHPGNYERKGSSKSI